ncbi:MAG: DUF2191 domain-containing protein, partial [Desulfobacteraceae bacterium IS3]
AMNLTGFRTKREVIETALNLLVQIKKQEQIYRYT